MISIRPPSDLQHKTTFIVEQIISVKIQAVFSEAEFDSEAYNSFRRKRVNQTLIKTYATEISAFYKVTSRGSDFWFKRYEIKWS